MFAVSLGDDGAELRPLEPWQAEEFLAHMERGREFIGTHIALPDAVDRPGLRARLPPALRGQGGRRTPGACYGVWLGGTLVGGVIFRTFDAARGNCEVGCWLEEAATGRGLVTRAIRVLIDWAVDVRGMHRIEWMASAENTPSINVARRLGMTRDGVLRESYLYRGVRHDSEIWAVLADEWRGRGRAARKV